MATGLAVAIIAVRQRAEEGVVLVGGEVVPEGSRAGSEPLSGSTIAVETEQPLNNGSRWGEKQTYCGWSQVDGSGSIIM